MTYKKLTDLLFSRQFLLSPTKLDNFTYQNWTYTTINGFFHIYSHPYLPVTQVKKDKVRLTLLGYLIDPYGPGKNDKEILEDLLRDASSVKDILISQEILGGRYVIIYNTENEAILKGFSNEAINKLKKTNLLNRLLLSKRQLKKTIGEDVCKGQEQQEGANFILANAHGNQHYFIMGDVSIYKLGLGLPMVYLQNSLKDF